MKSKSPSVKSLVCIALRPGWMEAMVFVPNGRGGRVRKCLSSALSLDPLSDDAELVGREWKTKLREAGVVETQCLICVPLQWAMSVAIDLPELSREDEASYIQLNVERAIPFALDDVVLSSVKFQTPDGKRWATLSALPKTYISALEAICRRAGLKPLSFTFAYPAAEGQRPGSGRVMMRKSNGGVDLWVEYNGAVAAMRRLVLGDEDDGTLTEYDAASLQRELRITLGQAPSAITPELNTLQVYGPSAWERSARAALVEPMRRLGLETVSGTWPEWIASCGIASGHDVFAPLALAAWAFVTRDVNRFEFCPPRIQRWKKYAARVASRGNLVFGGAAVLVAVIIAAMFIQQSLRLSSLESQWDGIRGKVTEVEALQRNVKTFKSWFDTSIPSLGAMRVLTEAFPEGGDAWTKLVEIEDGYRVSCSGFARSNRDFLEILDRLSEDDRVLGYQVQQVQYGEPLQFSLSLQWSGV